MSRTLQRFSKRRIVWTFAVAGICIVFFLAAVGWTQRSAAGAKNLTEGGQALPIVEESASPIFGVKVPENYRRWELISVSQGKTELKGIVGNATAMKAYRDSTLPFPDGSVLVKLSWTRSPVEGFDDTFEPGKATMVQVMVKDAKKYPQTGGWGFGRFIDGKPADEAQHQACFGCHSKNATVRAHDFVFTRFAH